MREIAVLVVPWIVTTWMLFALLRWDERRMTPAQRARAWPDASRLSAVVVFGVLCLPIHFTRTRRNVLGFLAGVGAMALVSIVSVALEQLVDSAFDLAA